MSRRDAMRMVATTGSRVGAGAGRDARAASGSARCASIRTERTVPRFQSQRRNDRAMASAGLRRPRRYALGEDCSCASCDRGFRP
eukprot:6739017-Prymnesium_polylepis.1